MSSFRKRDKTKTLPNIISPEVSPADVCERQNLNDPDLSCESQPSNDQPVFVNSGEERSNDIHNSHITSQILNTFSDLGTSRS